MSEHEYQPKTRRRRRGSLFWPILLISVGVIFLLDNLGVLPGEVWSNIFRLWPLLFIAWGLDGLWQRQGLIGPALLIGLGTVFLLSNFGLLALSSWQVIFNLWPVFLIAAGFDILVGRRSKLGALIGFVVVIGVLIGALWLMGVGVQGQVVRGKQIHQELPDARQARLVIEPGAGILKLDAMLEPVALVTGSVPDGNGVRVTETAKVSDGTATYSLRSAGSTFIFPGARNSYVWDLQINPEIPLELQAGLGAGDATLKLRDFDLNDLTFELGVGQATIYLPAEGIFDAKIDVAIGQLVIVVPEGMALRIAKDTAIVVVSYPQGYQVHDDIYTSPGYSGAENRIDLSVDMAIGQLVIYSE